MPRNHLVVIAVDGRIHVIGGRFKGSADRTGEHDVYDPATNKWTSAAPLPIRKRTFIGAIVMSALCQKRTIAERDQDVRFSNRPVGVKRFQTPCDGGVNVTRGLVLLYGIGT